MPLAPVLSCPLLGFDTPPPRCAAADALAMPAGFGWCTAADIGAAAHVGLPHTCLGPAPCTLHPLSSRDAVCGRAQGLEV
jgi:hypothetical protein